MRRELPCRLVTSMWWLNDQNDGAQSVAYFPASTAMFEPEAGSELWSMDERGVLAEALTTLGDHARRHDATMIAVFHYADALTLHYDLGARLGTAPMPGACGAPRPASRGKLMNAAWFLAVPRQFGAPSAHHPCPERKEDPHAMATVVRAQLDEAAFATEWGSRRSRAARGSDYQGPGVSAHRREDGGGSASAACIVSRTPSTTVATSRLTRREREVLACSANTSAMPRSATGSTSASAPSSSTLPTSSASSRSRIVATRPRSPLDAGWSHADPFLRKTLYLVLVEPPRPRR